mmetsp:Transcript_68635/g.143222  ORF Transcript_68635/g.143222 Transcript_68635/m.143222 type:complete len:80 (-) Transcript_68635:119-358(-)
MHTQDSPARTKFTLPRLCSADLAACELTCVNAPYSSEDPTFLHALPWKFCCDSTNGVVEVEVPQTTWTVCSVALSPLMT